MNIKLPPLNKRTVMTALVLAGIGTASSMISTYWQHRCQRKTLLYDHCLWKERLSLLSQQQIANEKDLSINSESGVA
jgi:hypothetical protein